MGILNIILAAIAMYKKVAYYSHHRMYFSVYFQWKKHRASGKHEPYYVCEKIIMATIIITTINIDPVDIMRKFQQINLILM